MRDLPQLLKALDATNANQVTVRTPANAGGADFAVNSKLSEDRTARIDRGVADAVCGGKSTMVEADEVTVLLDAGAKDTR